jgi:hypothetical protein
MPKPIPLINASINAPTYALINAYTCTPIFTETHITNYTIIINITILTTFSELL